MERDQHNAANPPTISTDPKAIEILERIFVYSAVVNLTTTSLPALADEASSMQDVFRDALSIAQQAQDAAMVALAEHQHMLPIEITDLVQETDWTEYISEYANEVVGNLVEERIVGDRVDEHFEQAIAQFQPDNFPLPSDLVEWLVDIATPAAEVFAQGISAIAQAISEGAFELLGVEGVLRVLDATTNVLDVVGDIGDAVSAVAEEVGLGIVMEIASEAAPIVGGGLALYRLARGCLQLVASGVEGVAGGMVQITHLVSGKEPQQMKGANLRHQSRLHLKEGFARSNAGLMGLVGQVPGMIFLTLPATMYFNGVAKRTAQGRQEATAKIEWDTAQLDGVVKAIACNKETITRMATHYPVSSLPPSPPYYAVEI